MQVSGLRYPLVSAPIQHALSETNSGFGSAHARSAHGARTRSSRRTRAARKLEDALGGTVFAGRTLHLSPRYIWALTCTSTSSQHSRPCGRGRADWRHAGRTAPKCREPRAGRCRADTGPLWPEHGMVWGCRVPAAAVPSTGAKWVQLSLGGIGLRPRPSTRVSAVSSTRSPFRSRPNIRVGRFRAADLDG
jgi:hypothetical protein